MAHSTSKGDPRLVNRGGRSLKSVKSAQSYTWPCQTKQTKTFSLRSSQKSSVRTGFTNAEPDLWSGSAKTPKLGPNFGSVLKSSGYRTMASLVCWTLSHLQLYVHHFW